MPITRFYARIILCYMNKSPKPFVKKGGFVKLNRYSDNR